MILLGMAIATLSAAQPAPNAWTQIKLATFEHFESFFLQDLACEAAFPTLYLYNLTEEKLLAEDDTPAPFASIAPHYRHTNSKCAKHLPRERLESWLGISLAENPAYLVIFIDFVGGPDLSLWDHLKGDIKGKRQAMLTAGATLQEVQRIWVETPLQKPKQ